MSDHAGPGAIHRSCVICTLPRSGSWLLAEELLAAGIGRPEEYLRCDWFLRFARTGTLEYQHRIDPDQAWGDGSPRCSRKSCPATVAQCLVEQKVRAAPQHDDYRRYQAFLDAILPVGTSHNIFAVKIHWEQLCDAVALSRVSNPTITDVELVREWVPRPLFVFLYRSDEIRRAISNYRADQTGIWWLDSNRSDAPRAGDGPPLDFSQIDDLRRRGRVHLRGWQDFFERAGISPLEITYEDLALAPHMAVEKIRCALEIKTRGKDSTGEPRLQRQADRWTDDAVHAYVTWRRTYGPTDLDTYGQDYVEAETTDGLDRC
jgi:LPS sulfotransferase NodH